MLNVTRNKAPRRARQKRLQESTLHREGEDGGEGAVKKRRVNADGVGSEAKGNVLGKQVQLK
jgi:hypothetical protein